MLLELLCQDRFFYCYWKNVTLQETSVILRTYTHEPVKPEGIANVKVEYQGNNYSLSLLVVKPGKVQLFGRDWFRKSSCIGTAYQV